MYQTCCLDSCLVDPSFHMVPETSYLNGIHGCYSGHSGHQKICPLGLQTVLFQKRPHHKTTSGHWIQCCLALI